MAKRISLRCTILAAAFAVSLFESETSNAEPPQLTITNTTSPIYSTRSSFYLQNDLFASVDGGFGSFDYTLLTGMTNQFFGKNHDILTAAGSLFYGIGPYRVGVTQSTFVRFEPRFFEFNRVAFPTRIYFQRPLVLPNALLLPEISVARRNAVDRPDKERYEIQPALSLLTALGKGVASLQAQFAYQFYKEDDRNDQNLFLEAAWTRPLSERTQFSLAASVEQNWSNKRDHSYTRFEIGPSITVTLTRP